MNKEEILQELLGMRKRCYDEFQRLDRLCRIFEIATQTDKAEEFMKSEMKKREAKSEVEDE